MSFLKNLTIKHKLISIIMLTSIVAMLIAGSAYIIYEQVMFRKEMVNSAFCYAAMIGDNCQAALAFGDIADAQETLASLRAKPSICYACVYDQAGKIFAEYQRCDITETITPPEKSKDSYKFDKDYLLVFKQIYQEGEVVGTVFLRSNLTELSAILKRNILIITLVILASSVLTYLITSRLQRVISGPILNLAQTAEKVSEKNDYSLRGIKQTNDEVGMLIDSFNGMLQQIQDRGEAIKESEEKFRTLYESSNDAVVLLGEEGFLDCNQSALRMYGCSSRDELLRKHPVDFSPEKQPGGRNSQEMAQYYVNQTFTEGSAKFEWIHRKLDGTEFPCEVLLSPMEIKGKNLIQGVVRDITERKQAEEEIRKLNEELELRVIQRTAQLQETHEKLLEASRQAGMAEVATDVLHNVGNVLNSINVSATLITEKVRGSEISDLQKVTDIIKSNHENLGYFFSEDPKGKHIPAYLTEVSRHLAVERNDIIEKLQSLSKNVEHIKEIVKMQQSYAKTSGVEVGASLDDLVEDAIQINYAGLKRHGVVVNKNIEDLPEVYVDKQKVLQILVNLINNAKYALSNTSNDEKTLTINIRRQGENRVTVEIIDNGIGIAEENLAKIFRHGFTTKRHGHGFGLHSGALAAKEMGGALTAWSKGPGTGAKFILELPYKAVQEVKNG
ncbi:MAG: PAS domain S-box protein [Sedimentisphaerales bacterium]|nr:PAS domain S-box protein [Sedimentisphaerales bacterium]